MDYTLRDVKAGQAEDISQATDFNLALRFFLHLAAWLVRVVTRQCVQDLGGRCARRRLSHSAHALFRDAIMLWRLTKRNVRPALLSEPEFASCLYGTWKDRRAENVRLQIIEWFLTHLVSACFATLTAC